MTAASNYVDVHLHGSKQFLLDEDGQDVVEYGLLIATLGLLVLMGASGFGREMRAWFDVLAVRVTAQTGG